IRRTSTPMETNKALTKDEDGKDVDIHSYRYLKGRPKLGIWYPKDSPFILEAFLDSDYVGASLDRKSTIGGCQFLGSSALDPKSDVGLWIQFYADKESAICVVKNPVYHFKTKHIKIRHHFIRDSYKNRLIEMVKIHTDNNVADLLTKAFYGRLMMFKCSGVYTSTIWIEVGMDYNCVERAITTAASLDTTQDIDNIIRTQTTAMPNVDIPQGMDTGGSPRRQDTMGGALAQTMSERVLEKPNEPPLSEGNTSGSGEDRMEHQFELMANVPITPYDSPLLGGCTPGSDKGRLKLQELMIMCTKLSKQVLDLEKEKEEILTS
ncbi:hypothetical protein Tco_1471364, partial [Tanacetum coccineum]